MNGRKDLMKPLLELISHLLDNEMSQLQHVNKTSDTILLMVNDW